MAQTTTRKKPSGPRDERPSGATRASSRSSSSTRSRKSPKARAIRTAEAQQGVPPMGDRARAVALASVLPAPRARGRPRTRSSKPPRRARMRHGRRAEQRTGDFVGREQGEGAGSRGRRCSRGPSRRRGLGSRRNSSRRTLGMRMGNGAGKASKNLADASKNVGRFGENLGHLRRDAKDARGDRRLEGSFARRGGAPRLDDATLRPAERQGRVPFENAGALPKAFCFSKALGTPRRWPRSRSAAERDRGRRGLDGCSPRSRFVAFCGGTEL